MAHGAIRDDHCTLTSVEGLFRGTIIATIYSTTYPARNLANLTSPDATRSWKVELLWKKFRRKRNIGQHVAIFVPQKAVLE